MPGFDASLNDRLVAHLAAQRTALAETWNQCFDDSRFQLQPRAEASLYPATLPEALQQPGLVALFEEADTGAVVLIPASSGLPAWYRTPTDSEKSRLDTLAMEWSLNLWPDDHAVERSGSLAVANLADYLAESQPAAEAALLTIDVLDEAGTVVGPLFIVWPVANRVWEVAAAEPEVAAPSSEPVAEAAPSPEPLPPPAPAAPVFRGPDPLARLRKLPVAVSVRLAEKKITVSQLLAITPGALVTFTKSCDDLLDLYVNNSLYCRGEAVKIGGSFGLKIDHVGVQVERESKLLQR
ncbi:MAG: FliM/FliN family flagellar motor C-terminal domain-containing protein [Planctomycetaceae bacterium]|nr:FliM/FliN family flagellar motor C-terminal domain-containing protein [Planctomycetaceae bacterium]